MRRSPRHLTNVEIKAICLGNCLDAYCPAVIALRRNGSSANGSVVIIGGSTYRKGVEGTKNHFDSCFALVKI
jgi:hypothetical protein